MFAIVSVFSVSAFAANRVFDFDLYPGTNNGIDFSAGNPKDDTEQAAHVHTTNNNLISADRLYYSVTASPSVTAQQYTGTYRITGNGATVMNYTITTSQGQYMYLKADTDVYYVHTEGYWYS